MAANGIFCLEGEWDADLRSRTSVLPLLGFLERLDQVQAIHRNVATTQELELFLRKWTQAKYGDYRILYLAARGDAGSLLWSKGNATSLAEVAATLGTSAEGSYVYVGSSLAAFDDRDARDFVRQTGAAAVVGFRREVEPIEATAFEVFLLSWLANHPGRPEALFKRLMGGHSELVQPFELVMVTQKGPLRSQDVTPGATS